MSYHATVEELSAYLDDHLGSTDLRRVESHLENCLACQERLASMRRVALGLRHLTRLAPPSTLDQVVARRIALDGERVGLVDRLERSMARIPQQSSTLAMFAVVIALAVMMLLFAQAVERHRNSTIPVIFDSPPLATAVDVGRDMERLEVAGRVLLREPGRWVEEGIETTGRPSTVVELGTDQTAGAEWLARHPGLAAFARFDAPILIEVEGEILELRPQTQLSP